MRLFMTPAGEEAWYAALVRNVRMQITRFEIGVLDVYTLSGAKQGGQTTSQFRTNNYLPNWTPDFNALKANDTTVYEGTLANVGYWAVQQNDGGLIIRIPASAPNMDIGNVKIYAKNTGPYPYATPTQGGTNNLVTDPYVQDPLKWRVSAYPSPNTSIGFDVSWTRISGTEAKESLGVPQALKLDASQVGWTKTASQLVYPINGNTQAVEAGMPVVISGSARNDSNHALVINCEWYTSAGTLISTTNVATIAAGVGKVPYVKRVNAPANASKVLVTFYNGNASAANTAMTGKIYVGPITIREPVTGYKRYEEVYDDEHGGEVLLFAGFASIADLHWQEPSAFPHFIDIRLSIHADGMFNVLDRSQFAFEQVVSVFEAETELELATPAANAYGCAVISRHSKTNLPAVFYRTHGAKQWVGYPLNESITAGLEFPRPIADANIDGGLLDHGMLAPPAIEIDTPQGTVISSQPRKLLLPDLTFTQVDVSSWSASTTPQAISLQPNTGQPYVATVRTSDLAFLGSSQQLYFVHNGTRYRIAASGRAYDTPPIIFRNGDLVSLEGVLQGPISSLSGYVYAELNEAPISVDVNNTPTWLLGKVSMHVTSTIAAVPNKMVFGHIGRRINAFAWDERTPEQYVSGLGYDMYGIPKQEPVTFRVVSSESDAGGTSFMFGGGQLVDGQNPSYLSQTYVGPDGKPVIRRSVTGLPGTEIRLLHNGNDVGALATLADPTGQVTITVKDTDRIGLRVVLVGRAENKAANLSQVLPAVAIAIEGVSSQGIKWFNASFDVASTFGPDGASPPPFSAMPTLTAPTALPQTIGANTLNDLTNNYLVNASVVDAVVNVGDPTIVYGPWFALMTAPNPTLPAANVTFECYDSTVTNPSPGAGTPDPSAVKIELIKFDPYGSPTPIVINNGGVLLTGTVAALYSGDAYRVKVTFTKPDHRIISHVRINTDAGQKLLTIDAAVRSA